MGSGQHAKVKGAQKQRLAVGRLVEEEVVPSGGLGASGGGRGATAQCIAATAVAHGAKAGTCHRLGGGSSASNGKAAL